MESGFNQLTSWILDQGIVVAGREGGSREGRRREGGGREGKEERKVREGGRES